MLNEVSLIGRLGVDPEERVMQNGDKVVNFSLATSEFWKDPATGERKERTEWHRIVVFNQRLIPIITSYLKKGSMAYIQGKIRSRKWIDPSTSMERYVTEIIVDRFEGRLVLLGGNTHTERSTMPSASSSGQMFGNDFIPTGPGAPSVDGPRSDFSPLSREKEEAEEDVFKDQIPF